jgi:hypothetical protein
MEPGRRALLLPLAVFVLAASLYGLNGRHGWLYRDDSIFAYSGQQLANGVPPYVSTFHAKMPLAPLLCGLGVRAARAVGADDLAGVRTTFLIVSAATAVSVYLLAAALFASRSAGIVAALLFVGFWGFGYHAFSGPRPKAPMVLFATLSLFLAARRHFVSASVSGSLAFLTWQPMGLFAAAGVALAGLQAREGARLRAAAAALAGAAVPVLVVLAFFGALGALPALLEDTLVFNLLHLERVAAPGLDRYLVALEAGYPDTKLLLVLGLGLTAAMLPWRLSTAGWRVGRVLREDPFAAVLLTFPAVVAWSALDFQSYPDIYVLLPYASLGCAGALHLGLDGLARRGWLPPAGRWAVLLLVGIALVGSAGLRYSSGRQLGLVLQREWSEQLGELAGPSGTVVSLGVPQVLVLLGRTNPNPFVFLCCGMESFVGSKHPEGFDGWLRDLAAERPSVIVVEGFRGPAAHRLEPWLRGYRRVRVGRWAAFVADRAPEEGRGRSTGDSPGS